MNVKEEGIIDSLKTISEMHEDMAKCAFELNKSATALHALTVSKVTAIAADVIAKQEAELAALRTKPFATSLNTTDIGQRIFIAGSPLQEHIIIAELQGKYLVSPTPIRESEPVVNIRLIDRTQAVFIDAAHHTVFDA